jgi:translation initiation factor 2 beta subunit (eIF-2beta)/eIF-5
MSLTPDEVALAERLEREGKVLVTCCDCGRVEAMSRRVSDRALCTTCLREDGWTIGSDYARRF